MRIATKIAATIVDESMSDRCDVFRRPGTMTGAADFSLALDARAAAGQQFLHLGQRRH
jgi:hypothetical protein